MTSWEVRWGAIVVFSLLVSTSFVLYGATFRAIGSPPPLDDLDRLVRYGVRTVLHPYFLLGMSLALAGAITRMFIFSRVGIAETALVSELTLVMSVVLSMIVFESDLRTVDYVGMCLIMIGVYCVQSGGG